jgi:chemotaxis protein MotB
MAAKKGHEEEHAGGSDRWLLTYADMITLLMIFFIILYSMSQVNSAKFDQLTQVLNQAFGASQSVINMNSLGILEKNRHAGESEKNARKSYNKAVEAFQKEIEAKQVSVVKDERGTVVRLSSDFYFASGSADLTSSALQILRKLQEIMDSITNDIQIEGHTDNVPINRASALAQRYPTNWELSSQRAINVLKYFEQRGLEKTRLSAVGYADNKPLKLNTVEENRSTNRRVEIVIVKQKEEPVAGTDGEKWSEPKTGKVPGS